MALAYTAPTWVNGSGTGISASQLQALSDCMEGLVQGSDKAITNISISGQTITLTFADGSQELGTASGLKGISSIAKTGTSGNVDTYTITYTDGSTSTFTVTNGTVGSFYTVSASIKSTDDPYGNIEHYIGGDFYENGVLYNQSAFYKVTMVDESEYPPVTYLIDDSSGTFTNGHYSTGSIGAIPSGATITTQIYTDSTMTTLFAMVKVIIGEKGADGEQGQQGPAGDDGVSPEVTITAITGGHRVNITDADHPSGQNFDVMDGVTQDISGKADKVSNATSGNFAGLDSNGNLTDSGKKASDFLPSNTPIPDAVTANPQGTATGTLTKLGIGSDIYDIQGGGSSDKADKTDIAPVENGTTASKAYSIGQQFYLNGSLYKAKAAIAQGATFTIGTNCELADCVTEQISNLCIIDTNEHLIGSFMGAPLYRKAFSVNQIVRTADTWVENTVSGVGVGFIVTKAYIVHNNINNTLWYLQNVDAAIINTNTINILDFRTTTITVGSNAGTIYLVLEYTKR